MKPFGSTGPILPRTRVSVFHVATHIPHEGVKIVDGEEMLTDSDCPGTVRVVVSGSTCQLQCSDCSKTFGVGLVDR